ncbi:MAG: metallophosphoesterase [Anaerolineae bacterium]
MRILTVSDKVEPVLYGPYLRERVGKIDLVLGCGDLPDYYLEYIIGLLDAPLFYVHGNHDRPAPPGQDRPPTPGAECGVYEWGVDLHGRTARYQGLLLAGLEGCRRYTPGAPFQYTEAQMRRQVYVLMARLFWNRLRYGRCLDILITHAPPAGIHDAEDVPHRGFAAYLPLLRICRPTLMIHGHTHIYNRNHVTETDFGATRIINTYGYRVLELAPQWETGGWELVRSS